MKKKQKQKTKKQSKSDPFKPLWGGERVVVERTSYPLAISVCEREREKERKKERALVFSLVWTKW